MLHRFAFAATLLVISSAAFGQPKNQQRIPPPPPDVRVMELVKQHKITASEAQMVLRAKDKADAARAAARTDKTTLSLKLAAYHYGVSAAYLSITKLNTQGIALLMKVKPILLDMPEGRAREIRTWRSSVALAIIATSRVAADGAILLESIVIEHPDCRSVNKLIIVKKTLSLDQYKVLLLRAVSCTELVEDNSRTVARDAHLLQSIGRSVEVTLEELAKYLP